MVSHLVETLRRETRLLLGQMLADGGGTREGFRDGEAVMEAPQEVGRDNA